MQLIILSWLGANFSTTNMGKMNIHIMDNDGVENVWVRDFSPFGVWSTWYWNSKMSCMCGVYDNDFLLEIGSMASWLILQIFQFSKILKNLS
jgi:hypothetical protein